MPLPENSLLSALSIDLFTDTAAILDSIVLAKTLWDAQGENDPKNCTVLQC